MTAHMHRPMVSGWILIYLLVAGQAHAETDYALMSEAWNGLSSLVSMAKNVGVQVLPSETLDWGVLDEHQVLLLVGPQVAPSAHDKAQLQRFLESGGHLIVADDFRQGRDWTADFGIDWRDTGGRSGQLFAGNPQLPRVQVTAEQEDLRRAKPWLDPRAKLSPPAFLGHNLNQRLVLNHPAVLQLRRDAQAALWGHYDRCNTAAGQENRCGWLAEAAVDGGRVLAVADGSVLVNQMLAQVYENKQFTANLLRYYCMADRPCQVRLVVNLATTQGTFEPRHGETERDWRTGLRAAQRALTRAAQLLQASWMIPPLIALLLWALWRPIRRTATVPQPTVPPRPAAPHQTSAVAGTVSAWLAAEDADYRQPAVILSRHLLHLLQRLEPDATAEIPAGTGPGVAKASVGQGALRRSGTWRREAGTIEALVRGGRCSPAAGARLREVLSNLQQVTQDGAPPLPRRRFGQLAAEVEWAESLLRYTQNAKENHV